MKGDIEFKLVDIVPHKYYPKGNTLAMMGYLSSGVGTVYRVTKSGSHYEIGMITDRPYLFSASLMYPGFLPHDMPPMPVFTPKKGAKTFPSGNKSLVAIISRTIRKSLSKALKSLLHSLSVLDGVPIEVKRGLKDASKGRVSKRDLDKRDIERAVKKVISERKKK
jgi:hypothetical protein